MKQEEAKKIWRDPCCGYGVRVQGQVGRQQKEAFCNARGRRGVGANNRPNTNLKDQSYSETDLMVA